MLKIKRASAAKNAKKIQRLIKDSKLKVQAAIQGDAVRVTGAKRDDLQAAMALMRKEMADVAAVLRQFPRLMVPHARSARCPRGARQWLGRPGATDREALMGMRRRSFIASLAIAAPLGALAQTVSMAGSIGDSKALLMINGAPHTLAVGSTIKGVTLSADPGQAEVEVGGKRLTVGVGGAPASVGSGGGGGATGREIVIAAGPGGHFVTTARSTASRCSSWSTPAPPWWRWAVRRPSVSASIGRRVSQAWSTPRPAWSPPTACR